MCDYTGRHFGAHYEDAACHSGYLYDLDGDGWDGNYDYPCPACNTASYLDSAKEDAETTSWGMFMTHSYCGAMIIENALVIAKAANADATQQWQSANPSIHTWDWPDRKAVLDGRADPETTIPVILR